MIAAAEKKISVQTDFLKKLNIQSVSSGVCTGTEWLSPSGEEIASYSPVDGNLIGRVKTASQSDYEKVIAAAE